jgi:hypothetical protein
VVQELFGSERNQLENPAVLGGFADIAAAQCDPDSVEPGGILG